MHISFTIYNIMKYTQHSFCFVGCRELLKFLCAQKRILNLNLNNCNYSQLLEKEGNFDSNLFSFLIIILIVQVLQYSASVLFLTGSSLVYLLMSFELNYFTTRQYYLKQRYIYYNCGFFNFC